MNIRFFGGKTLSMAENDQISNDEVWIKDDKILYIGKAKPADFSWDREIDLKGNLLLPGFKNAHTHSAMTFLRSFADDLPLLDWLQKQVFPMEAKLNADDIYWLSRLAILEYLSSGMTANFDMYYHPEAVASASVDSGFRTVLCGEINDFSGSVSELSARYEAFNKLHPLINYRLGFHAEYTCSDSLLREISSLAAALHAPVYTHLAECADEVSGCFERHNASPAQYLSELGIFENGGGGFHCVHMSDEDLKIFRDKKLWVISNPGSNAKLASGTARLCEMDKMGIPIALGTDGPASNNCLDMFREMFLATALQKLKYNDASVMDAASVLKMAAVNGARAMGLSNCDCLAPGKQADICVISLQHPNMQPENNIIKNIVYSGSKQNVALTMVAGKILYENGSYKVGEQPEYIYKKANE
ncbi:MAG: amidohydrolase, partial [Oscillospiraceae bacterium]